MGSKCFSLDGFNSDAVRRVCPGILFRFLTHRWLKLFRRSGFAGHILYGSRFLHIRCVILGRYGQKSNRGAAMTTAETSIIQKRGFL